MLLNVKVFAFVCGVAWALGLFIVTWGIIIFQGASRERTLIGKIYRGYTISPLGSIIGFMWAFMDGIITGVILAALYNVIITKIM